MSEIRNVIVELLGQFSANREARDYLLRFSSVANKQFAVIKVGGGVMANEMEELASALAFLRHVGLFPIVLHGAGPQLNSALEAAGIEPRFVDNLRFTDSEILGIARPIVYEQSQFLVEALERHNVRSRMIQHGVFECDYLDQSRYGLVGDIKKVNLQSIDAAIQAGALPIVNCFGESTGGQVLNINADRAATALVTAIKPHKIVFLTPTGGLLNDSGQVISAINLRSDYDHLTNADWLHSGMSLKLEQIKSLLDQLPPTASVSITSARQLTKELFTHKGAGTLIRSGETFEVHSALSDEQESKLRQLLERCFGRPLQSDYFDCCDIDRVLCSSSFRAAAIVTRDADNIPYLDKFAVTPNAQGEGLGTTLWNQVTRHYPQIYWRARPDKQITPWYLKQADAVLRRGDWLVFACGFEDMSELDNAVNRAAALPESWQASNIERFLRA
ncbi:MAG: acetylglutamate kinase [Woeseiaceae bacterium]